MYKLLSLSFTVLILLTSSLFAAGQPGEINIYDQAQEDKKNILIVHAQDMDFERIREFSSGFTSYVSKNKINSSVHIVKISQAETFEGKAALLKEIFSAKSIFHTDGSEYSVLS